MIKIKASQYNKLFWFDSLKQSDAEQYRYHVPPMQFKYIAKPDTKRLHHALQITVNLNYNLRSNFIEENGELMQVIHSHIEVTLDEYHAQTKEEYEDLLVRSIKKPFDLGKDPLFRFLLIHDQSDLSSKLILVIHHIILDGTQFGALTKCIEHYYHHPSDLKHSDQKDVTQLQSYLKWEEQQVKISDTEYWITKLKQYPWTINLPLRTKIDEKSDNHKPQLYELDDNLHQRLKKFSEKSGYSIFNILKTVYAALISQYAGQNQLIITHPFNMKRKEFNSIKGAFLNTLFYCFDNQGTFIENLSDQIKDFTEPKKYANVIDILSVLKPDEGTFPATISSMNVDGLRLECPAEIIYDFNMSIGASEIVFVYYEVENTLFFIFLTSPNFDNLLKERIHINFSEALKKVLDNPNLKLSELNHLKTFEHDKMLYQWNATDKAPAKDKTIIKLFEQQVELTPERNAVTSGNEQITYKELNEKANQLAHFLIHSGVVKGDLIAVGLERSILLNIMLLGILKAGAVYVPIEINYPNLRIQHIFQDNEIRFLFAQEEFCTRIKNLVPENAQLQYINLDADWQKIQSFKKNKVNIEHQPNDLIYVIYTSGSTGLPKGIIMEDKTLTNLINWQSSNENKIALKVTQFASIGFDVSIQEMTYTLLNGYELVIIPENIKKSAFELVQFLEKYSINQIFLPTAILEYVLQAANSLKPKLDILNRIIIAGEALQITKTIRTFFEEYPHILLENQYGPAETHVVSSYKLSGDPNHWNLMPSIGQPISNTRIYTLNEHLKPVPLGVIGELYIGGISPARGYLNRSDMTRERFILNPFATESDKKNGYTTMYKTGDLGRWLPNGILEYIGRNDSQVKIRGYRIELAEIENALTQYSDIKQSVVLTKDRNGNKYLVAYYVAIHAFNVSDLIEFLSQSLPEYMIPNFFVHLSELPMTINGKLDRKALPDPVITTDIDKYIAPGNELEEELCKIWGSILGIEKIGITDDFFKIGGNSILAMQASFKMSHYLNQHVAVSELFKHRTILRLLDAHLTAIEEQIVIPEQFINEGILSFEQERLWNIEQGRGGTHAYHIPLLLLVENNFNSSAFEKSIQSIVSRYEILRTVFKKNQNDQYYQSVLDNPVNIKKQVLLSKDELSTELVRQIHTVFDLTNEYPIKVCLYSINKVHYILVLFHHIAFDGWSINLFFDELNGFYQHFIENNAYKPRPLHYQYKDFAAWQRSYYTGDVLAKKLQFWQKKLTGFEQLQFPIDKTRPPEFDYCGENIFIEFDAELSAKLRTVAALKGTTLFSILLTGFYVVLNKYTSQTDLIVGIPIANRYRQQFENLIGLFVNSLALRMKLQTNQTFSKLIDKTKEILMEAQTNQDLPFEQLAMSLKTKKDASRHPIYQIMFTVQSFSVDEKYFKLLPIHEYYTVAKFDLLIMISDSSECIKGSFNYATSIFHRDTIEKLTKQYKHVLEQLVTHSDQPIENLSLINLK